MNIKCMIGTFATERQHAPVGHIALAIRCLLDRLICVVAARIEIVGGDS